MSGGGRITDIDPGKWYDDALALPDSKPVEVESFIRRFIREELLERRDWFPVKVSEDIHFDVDEYDFDSLVDGELDWHIKPQSGTSSSRLVFVRVIATEHEIVQLRSTQIGPQVAPSSETIQWARVECHLDVTFANTAIAMDGSIIVRPVSFE